MTIARAGCLALAALGAIVVMAVGAGTASARSYRPGIDVSNHQGRIAWPRVARDGEQFVFAKATEGVTYEDPTYARNKRAASKHRLKVGAYHYARPGGGGPDARRADARSEAKHFLSVANLHGGNLLPVLDLEETGGLSPRGLIRWSRSWLEKVRERLGARGMIYTSPYFWRTYMRDTKWFADHGYRAVWIADWRTRSPDVPARNWNGKGWTFWQWTDCGHVDGISGCVDRDLYRGRRWSKVLIDGGRKRRPISPPPLEGPLDDVLDGLLPTRQP